MELAGRRRRALVRHASLVDAASSAAGTRRRTRSAARMVVDGVDATTENRPVDHHHHQHQQQQQQQPEANDGDEVDTRTAGDTSATEAQSVQVRDVITFFYVFLFLSVSFLTILS